MAPSEQPLRYPAGQVLAGRFRIVQFLGRGGMGEVYEAADLDLNQHVALKLIRPESRTDPKLLAMLRAEVRKARSVSHANVCRVYDLERDETTGAVFVTMELLRGETIHARLSRGERFGLPEALSILRQVAEGMDAIHALRMLHLDFKSANVMLESVGGETRRAVVTDFGLAQSQAPKHSAESTDSLLEIRGGTPAYMAPERLHAGAALSPAADVYAFGLLAYEMLVGSAWIGPPGVPPSSLRAVLPEVPAEWDAMVRKCVAAAPGDRFATCGAALASLQNATQVQLAARRQARRYRRTLTLAGAAIVLLGVAVFVLRPSGPRASPAALRWYSQGVDAIREGTYYKAVRALDQSVKESPGYPLTHASLAEAWLELDSPDRASEELLLATGPGNASDRLDSSSRDHLQAIHHTVTRDYEKAAADYSNLAQSAAPAERPRALVDLGRALERTKQPGKAMEQFAAAAKLDPNYAGAYLRLAIVAGQLEQWPRMTAALERAESLYEAASNQEGVTEVYYQRGAYAAKQAHLSEAARWLAQARQSALSTHNPHQQIRALHLLGVVAYQKGDTAAGQQFAEDAIREARANNIESLTGRGFLDLGNAVLAHGDGGRAEGYFQEALRIARHYHNEKLEATALYSLGSLGIRTRPDEAAARQVERALQWYQANGYPGEASRCLLILGRFRRDRGDLAAAAAAYERQVELARASHNESQAALAQYEMVSVLIRQERFPEALALTLECLPVFQRLGDGLHVGYARQNLARIYSELGRFAESAAAAQEAKTTALNGKLEELLVNIAVTRTRGLLLAGRAPEAAASADQALRTWEAKYPQLMSGLLGILALARTGSPPATRLAWCERSRKLSSGSVAAELTLRLTEAELHLQAKNARQALDACRELRPALERQQSEYSLFRAEAIEALALRQLGQNTSEAVARADAALERFQKRFDKQAWQTFGTRPDFRYWENNLRHIRAR